MTYFFWIILLLALLFLLLRFLSFKMYDIKQTPHTETPASLGLDFEEITIPTRNERQLYGWWLPSNKEASNAPTLILVHGWTRNLGRMLRYIQHLHPLGYNLLAFDARHHGSSDRDDHASMYKFGQDVQAAVKFAAQKDIDKARIGVAGLSIGGAGAIYASGLEPLIKAVVTVGAPAHPVDIMDREFRKHHMPALIRKLILGQIESKIGEKYENFAPVNNISRSSARFLLIHGMQDQVVLSSQAEKLEQAADPDQAELWLIPEAGHSNCHHTPGFWNRLHVFLSETLGKESSS